VWWDVVQRVSFCKTLVLSLNPCRSSLRRLRIGIILAIVVQLILQFTRTLRTFECQYVPKTTGGLITNVLMIAVFLYAMWGLIVVYKSG
jgi:hypothetical protein